MNSDANNPTVTLNRTYLHIEQVAGYRREVREKTDCQWLWFDGQQSATAVAHRFRGDESLLGC